MLEFLVFSISILFLKEKERALLGNGHCVHTVLLEETLTGAGKSSTAGPDT